MDFLVLELGLKNRQLSTIKCFLKIQLETFRLSWIKGTKGNAFQDDIFNWEQMIKKLILVINAHIADEQSKSFAVSVSRITFETLNQLLKIISLKPDPVDVSTKLRKLFISNIRLIRFYLKVSHHLKQFDKECDNWNSLEQVPKTIEEALLAGHLTSSQCFLKPNNWNDIVKCALKISISFLKSEEIARSSDILKTVGISVDHFYAKIFLYTTNEFLRRILLKTFSKCSQEDLEALKFIKISQDTKPFQNLPLSFNIEWIKFMSQNLKSKILCRFVQDSCDFNAGECQKLMDSESAWNYLLDKNDSEKLRLWIDNFVNEDNKGLEWFFKWPIDIKMIDMMDEVAMIQTHEVLLDALANYGLFCSRELNDFNLILNRIGSANGFNLRYLSSFAFSSKFEDMPIKLFERELIEYSISNQLFEFLYLFIESTGMVLNNDSFLLKLIHSSLFCAKDATSENVLQHILLTFQYIKELEQSVDLFSLIDGGFVYLAIVAMTFLTQEIEKKNYYKYILENSPKLNLKSDYSIIYEALLSQEDTGTQIACHYEHQTIYNLLKDTIPFDLSKLFCWQKTNTLKNSDDSCNWLVFNELPHFSHEKLANLYGLKANLSFTYFIAQGRPLEAFTKYINNSKNANLKNIDSACKRVALVSYNNILNKQVANSAVIFHHLLKEDTSAIVLHLKVSEIITKYSSNFLGISAKQQQMELNDLIKKAQYYKENKAALKLYGILCASISRKYQLFEEIKPEECLDWSLAVKFALFHNLDLPVDFLNKCAEEDEWLLFVLYTQIHQYPKSVALSCLNSFNNKVIADHLEKVYQSSQAILKEKTGESKKLLSKMHQEKSDTSARHLRNVLYTKIGLNSKRISKTRQFDNNNMQISRFNITPQNLEEFDNDDNRTITESEINAAETISVFSSSVASDTDFPKFDSCNAPKDLFQILGLQVEPIFGSKFLLHSSISLSNPVLSLIAASINSETSERDLLACFSSWLLAAIDSDTRKIFCQKSIDFLSLGLKEYLILLDLVFQKDCSTFLLYLRGLELFGLKHSPLTNLFQFLSDFLVEKVYDRVEGLKNFQENLWNDKVTNESMFNKTWTEKIAILALTNSLKVVETFYELRILLRHYDFSRIQDSFSTETQIPDFRKIYKLCQCLSETPVKLPLRELLDCAEMQKNCKQDSGENFISIIKKVVLELQKNHYFNEAKQFANIAGVDSTNFVINEWMTKALIETNLNKVEFWFEFWDNFTSNHSIPLKNFKKFTNQITVPLIKALITFKCLHLSVLKQLEWTDLEIQLWKLVIAIESNPIEENDLEFWNRLWSEIVNFIKSDFYKQLHESNAKITKVEIESFDIVVAKLLNSFCIDEAYQIAQIFGYHNSELDITLACHNIAKGKIKKFLEMPLSIQLTSAGVKQNKNSNALDISDDQNEMIDLIEHMCSLTSLSRKACQKILLYFKISCILGIPYLDIVEQDQIEIVKKLIASSIYNPDSLSLAKELINFNDIPDDDVATIVCNEVLIVIKSNLSDIIAHESSLTSSEIGGCSFLSLVRLLNDPVILGQKLLSVTNQNNEQEDASYDLFLAEMYIKAHECFTLACDVKGISIILRKARILITQRFVPRKEYNSIIRLLTGIGRYSEMTYCFDIIKENDQFEMLLSKRMEKVPQLRVALVDYLKGDKEMFPLVALRFCLFREIAETHEFTAHRLLNKIDLRRSLNLISFRSSLEEVVDEFVDAHESYLKAGCYSHADVCAKVARLVALQIQYLPGNLIVIRLNNEEVINFIVNCFNFFEALIISEAYQSTRSWAEALFNNVILRNDWNYFRDFTSQIQLNASLIEEVTRKYLSMNTNLPAEKLSSTRKNMQRLLTYNDKVATTFNLSWQVGIVEATNKLMHDPSAAYLQDLRRNGNL